MQGCRQKHPIAMPLAISGAAYHCGTWKEALRQSQCMQVVSSINNLIIGKIYVDHGGVMRITSSATGMVCKLKFREQGILSRHEAHEVCALLCGVISHAIPQSSAITSSFSVVSQMEWWLHVLLALPDLGRY